MKKSACLLAILTPDLNILADAPIRFVLVALTIAVLFDQQLQIAVRVFHVLDSFVNCRPEISIKFNKFLKSASEILAA